MIFLYIFKYLKLSKFIFVIFKKRLLTVINKIKLTWTKKNWSNNGKLISPPTHFKHSLVNKNRTI